MAHRPSIADGAWVVSTSTATLTKRETLAHAAFGARMIPAVEERDPYCLHQSRSQPFCYQPTSHVLVRASDGFAMPVCHAHVEAAQLALTGRLEVVPIEQWLAASRG